MCAMNCLFCKLPMEIRPDKYAFYNFICCNHDLLVYGAYFRSDSYDFTQSFCIGDKMLCFYSKNNIYSCEIFDTKREDRLILSLNYHPNLFPDELVSLKLNNLLILL